MEVDTKKKKSIDVHPVPSIDAETRTRDLVAADFKLKTSPNYKNTPDEFLT